jgi:hypothetical protein
MPRSGSSRSADTATGSKASRHTSANSNENFYMAFTRVNSPLKRRGYYQFQMSIGTRHQLGPRRRGSGTNCGLRPPLRQTNHREGPSAGPRIVSDHPYGLGTNWELARGGTNHNQRLVKLLARRMLILLRASAGQTQKEVQS